METEKMNQWKKEFRIRDQINFRTTKQINETKKQKR